MATEPEAPVPHGEYRVGDLGPRPWLCGLCKLRKTEPVLATGLLLLTDPPRRSLDLAASCLLVCDEHKALIGVPALPLTCQRCGEPATKVLLPNGHDLAAGVPGNIGCTACVDVLYSRELH